MDRKIESPPVAWWLELASALSDVEKIAARGGAYGLAQRAQKLASLLRIAETLQDAQKKADEAILDIDR